MAKQHSAPAHLRGCDAKFYDLGRTRSSPPPARRLRDPEAPPPRGGRAYAPRSAYDPNAQVAARWAAQGAERARLGNDADENKNPKSPKSRMAKKPERDAPRRRTMLEELDEK